MSEYIITDKQLGLIQDFANVCVEGEKLPNIVRCRDCAECEHWKATERKPERYICLSNYCIEVNPNDFCAWGVKK